MSIAYFIQEDAFGHLTADVRIPLCPCQRSLEAESSLGKGRGMPGFCRNVFLSQLSVKRRPFIRSASMQPLSVGKQQAIRRADRISWVSSPFGNFLYSKTYNQKSDQNETINFKTVFKRPFEGSWSLQNPTNFSGVLTFKNEIL